MESLPSDLIGFYLLSYRSNIQFAEPRIHAFVYEPTTGAANHLKVDFNEYIRDIREIYEMYKIEDHPSS
jgi:adenosylmethionine-8-amino-7-oxononanoate aminotransferase